MHWTRPLLFSACLCSCPWALPACGGRVDAASTADAASTDAGADVGSSDAAPDTALDTIDPTAPLRDDLDAPCAFGAAGTSLAWIDGARRVRAAAIARGAKAIDLGRSGARCALSVADDRVCFGDDREGVTCVSADGTRRVEEVPPGAQPVAAVQAGEGKALAYARGRLAFVRHYFETSFSELRFDAPVETLAGDFDPTPDDGFGFAATDVNTFRRGVDTTAHLARPLHALAALDYERYLGLDDLGGLVWTQAVDPGIDVVSALPRPGGAIRAMAVGKHPRLLVLVEVGAQVSIVAHPRPSFEAKLGPAQSIAHDQDPTTFAVALTPDQVLWATRTGKVFTAPTPAAAP